VARFWANTPAGRTTAAQAAVKAGAVPLTTNVPLEPT
jgi:hypothetical protein